MLPLRLFPWFCLGCAALGACQSTATPPPAPARAAPPALEHNAALAAARERAQGSSEAAIAAGRLPNPRLAWAEFAEELQTRTGPHVRRIGLRQSLPWPGTLASQRRVAEAAAAGATGRTHALIAATELELARASIERGLLAAELQLQAAGVQLLQALEPIVAARLRAGGARQDSLRLAVELARARDHQLHLEASAAPLEARLAELHGSPHRLPVVEAMADPGDFTLAPDLEERVLGQSPQLAPLRARIAEAQARLQLRGKQRLPQLGLGVDWLQVDGALDPQTPGSGRDPFAFLVELDLPLWTRADDATERSAAHALRAAHLDLEAEQHRLRTAFQQIRFAAEDAQRRRHLHRDSLLPMAEESLQLVTSAYRAGAASLLEVLETERLRLDLQLALARAGADQRIALAQLRALLGEAR